MPEITCLCAHVADVHERPDEPLLTEPGTRWSWYPANRCEIPSCGCMSLRVRPYVVDYAAFTSSLPDGPTNGSLS